MIKLVECPRDAMQGIKEWIPTELKISYLNQLLQVGFHTIDAGSFVSEKAIPQMKDTAEVLQSLDRTGSASKLLVITANQRGAATACDNAHVDIIGFPFSVSQTFQQRNTNSSIEESLIRVKEISEMCKAASKELVVYISMGFGNPYGDEWSPAIVIDWCKNLHESTGVNVLALSDTVGAAKPGDIRYLFETLIPAIPSVEFGAHLHTTPFSWKEKVESAYQSGCLRFDGAIRGFGGCPMATDDLTGNMPTENMVEYFNQEEVETGIDHKKLQEAIRLAEQVFPAH